ncbi:MAG: DUF6443 domain-containing protein [Ferruginibacter sp.]
MQFTRNRSAKHFILSVLILSSNVAISQVATVPVAYSSGTPINYIRTFDATAPEQDATTLMSRYMSDVKVATQYMDGLGRPLQTVIKSGSLTTASGAVADVVSPVIYDEYGREKYKYLPFVANATALTPNTNDGKFKLDPFQQQAVFMNQQYGSQGEHYFYSKTNFEASPLSRVEESFAPGDSWASTYSLPNETDRKSVKMKYWINTLTDAVRIWNVTDVANSFGTYSSPGVYDAGQLYKNVSVDENNKQVIEFKDKEGKVIFKKVQISSAAGIADDGTGRGYAGWLSTYYIYDDLGNLRSVIQPKGVELISPTWVLTDATILAEQCFRYAYDTRNRMIMKQVPGAAPVYMVYDQRDRLVMTQDGNMRTLPAKWMVTIYDNLNRPVQTGLWTNANDLAYHSAQAANSAYYYYPFNEAGIPGSGWEGLTVTHYDNYNNLPTGLSAAFDNTWSSNFYSPSNTTYPYPQAQTPTAVLTGMVTWTQVKVLNSTQYLSTLILYDDKGRVIQTKIQNITTGLDINTTQYSWAGQPIVSVLKTEKAGSINPQTHVIVSKIQYDDLGRVLNTSKAVKSNIAGIIVEKSEQRIVSNQYDALGQLKSKKLAPEYNSNVGLQTSNYDYNIRGWMLGMNRDYMTASPVNTNEFFGMELAYDKTTASATGTSYAASQFNGNIAGTLWKSAGDGVNRQYDFSYDNANRLLKADFKQKNDDNSWNKLIVDYSVKMGDGTLLPDGNIDYTKAYDANGNIKQMQQWGLKINTSGKIDDLIYGYVTNSNKLAKVSDGVVTSDNGKLGDFKDGANGAADDYSYDVNGNLNLDQNKSISSITYNYLNLPAVITITGKGAITYTYDAAGNKLKKVTSESPAVGNGNKTITTTTNYIKGFVYESKTTVPVNTPNNDYTDVLQLIPHEEGRVRFKPAVGSTPADFAYDYFIKDHLGNVRMVLTEEKQLDHYPTATLEGSGAGSPVENEKAFYDINNAYVQNQPSSLTTTYINDNGTNNPTTFGNPNANSQKMYKLNATTNNTGLGMVLKVMAGDKINVLGKSYYHYSGGGVVNTPFNASTIISAFLGVQGMSNIAIGHGATSTILNSNAIGTTIPIGAFSNGNPVNSNNNVKAGIAYILFDEQFKYAGGGFDAVDPSTAGALKSHILPDIIVPKNGYIYIYCSNESNIDVFFDNLEVVDQRSQILEETHYYPFGLTMAGISSKAAGSPQNKYKFNGGNELQNQEFSDGSGLELYDANNRMYDHQIGRFWKIDELAEIDLEISPYVFANNNPILFNDPLGLTSDTAWKRLDAVVVTAQKPLDLKNGQIMPSRSIIWDYVDGPRTKFMIGKDENGRINMNNYYVDNRGYLTDRKAPFQLMALNQPFGFKPTSLKAIFNLKNFIKGEYVIYKFTKNGLPYIGKALGSLISRYGSEAKVAELGVEAIKGLTNLTDNATALGVEQLVIELNGGIGTGSLANKIPATVKEIYINTGRLWLDSNIPNWEHVLKFQ